jgi:hypothetical protein
MKVLYILTVTSLLAFCMYEAAHALAEVWMIFLGTI